ncbi:ribulose-phosphate 3-epimerase [[Clostridium] polysaccharolyticum]|jgi:ribulose-phosphate 3-epimerase|uniref:Ribulose-phosphate 3-epimerase n=1 Tax=[Clostridium] polysaccharolyticum TaxID=29364 RepID=A0A1H9Y0S1_9FIRM|nr:ribulose-phosphate 3-epimerase [[Clostridium] polysaccharolyticum]SES62328.1 ribulose-phosphate 3-epimerase [[Clostridium] polysaccharolyticum]
MYKLAPSLLAADFKQLHNQIEAVDKAGAHMLHIDVMDGIFVPSISFGMPLIQSIREVTKIPFDVHLMIEEPSRYVEEFKKCGADILTVHAEACKHLNRTVMAIKDAGMKASVALNPATPLNVLDYVLEELDMVLIMSVNPGFGGQTFIPNTLAKIEQLRKMVELRGLATDIQVDGGVSMKNAKTVLAAGANVLVAGTAVYKGDVEKNIQGFKEVFASAE